MPDLKHRLLTTDNGIHYIQAWEVGDATERDGLAVTDIDAGKVCRLYSDASYWVLADAIENEGGGTFNATWRRLDNVDALALSDAAPTIVEAYTEQITEGGTTYTGEALSGSSPDAARADHQHNIATGLPVAIGDANYEGDSAALARADHVHDGSALLDVLIVGASGSATLSATHVRRYVRTTSASAHTLTVPFDFADMPIGSAITGIQAGAGRTQFVAAGGVTLNCSAQLYTRTQYSGWTLVKVATNTYDLTGDLLI